MVSPEIERLNATKSRIHRRLVDLLYQKPSGLAKEDLTSTRKRALVLLENLIDASKDELPSQAQREEIIKEIMDQTLGFGALEDFLKDAAITEIMINGSRAVYVEKEGRLSRMTSTFRDDKEVMALIEKVVSPLGRRIDESSPLVDARLPDGSRVNAIIPPLSLNGPCLTIRKFKTSPFTQEELLQKGSITKQLIDFLQTCVKGRCNILISGGTGSGKTTLLNLIAQFIPPAERIISIEDAAELRLPQEHVVSLESRPPNIEGAGEIPIRTLVRNALRMRPDRIIVGECRGGEALDMLQAMNTGHDGSLTTAHANDTREMLIRLETMVLMSGLDLPLRAIREQIASAINLIVHIERFHDGSRRVSRVSEICGMEGEVIVLQDLYRFDVEVKNKLIPTGMIPQFRSRLLKRGVQLDLTLFKDKP